MFSLSLLSDHKNDNFIRNSSMRIMMISINCPHNKHALQSQGLMGNNDTDAHVMRVREREASGFDFADEFCLSPPRASA